MTKITAQMLRDKDACSEQVAIFEQQWPNGVKVGIHAVRKAGKLGLDVYWFAANFLTDAAWAGYEEVRDAALAECRKARDAALVAAWKEMTHD